MVSMLANAFAARIAFGENLVSFTLNVTLLLVPSAQIKLQFWPHIFEKMTREKSVSYGIAFY